MRMTGVTTDRKQAPLMKALHEVGLAHGVELVVVAIPIKGCGGEVRPLLIDHKDETPVVDVINRFTGAGVFLIKCAAAAEEYAYEQEQVAAAETTPEPMLCPSPCPRPRSG